MDSAKAGKALIAQLQAGTVRTRGRGTSPRGGDDGGSVPRSERVGRPAEIKEDYRRNVFKR